MPLMDKMQAHKHGVKHIQVPRRLSKSVVCTLREGVSDVIARPNHDTEGVLSVDCYGLRYLGLKFIMTVYIDHVGLNAEPKHLDGNTQ